MKIKLWDVNIFRKINSFSWLPLNIENIKMKIYFFDFYTKTLIKIWNIYSPIWFPRVFKKKKKQNFNMFIISWYIEMGKSLVILPVYSDAVAGRRRWSLYKGAVPRVEN